MPRSSRSPLALLVASLLLAVACAQGADSASSAPDAGAVQSTEPTEPPSAPPPDRDAAPPPTDPDEALRPEVDSVSPDSATVGSVGPSITVTGNNFVPRSIVQLDGAPLATTFVSGTELRATIPTSKLATVGTLRISVGTSPPGGGASQEIAFRVENPAPALTQIAPLSVLVGAAATPLHVTGTGFVDGTKVVFGGTDLTTTVTGATALDATIPAALLVTPGSVPVKVVSPGPGGGDSTSIAFTIANPSAAVQGINPSAAFVGSAAVTLTVNGSGFVSGSQALFNGSPLATSFVSSSKLTATIPSPMLGAAGDFPVTVSNPPPGGGLSAPVVFRVQYPSPSTSGVSPSTAPIGSGPTDVTVTGLGFFLTSQITFDGAPAATTYVDSTHLQATLSAAQLASAGTIAVRVVNPAPGGGTSAAVSFAVTNAAPSITGLTPSSVTAGSPDRTVTITGTSFVGTSTVKSNGVAVTTTYVSPTQLTAVVPANQLLYPGTVSLTVTNPPPGGGTSAPRSLTVGCDTSGVDVALGPTGTVTTLATSFATAPAMSVFGGSGSCATTTIDPSTTEPARYWIVQNTAGAPVTLSAWAVCTADGKQDDAFLTFYKRPTAPANDTERLACASVIAEGINGDGGYSSPEAGASMWCPGLTKANGGGLVLGVCEKAVVHIQPYDVAGTTYTPPPQIKVKAE